MVFLELPPHQLELRGGVIAKLRVLRNTRCLGAWGYVNGFGDLRHIRPSLRTGCADRALPRLRRKETYLKWSMWNTSEGWRRIDKYPGRAKLSGITDRCPAAPIRTKQAVRRQ